MSLPVTLALLILFAGLAAVCRWRGTQPLDITRGPRLVPWAALMLACVVICILMIVHLLNLVGVETGRR